MLLSLFRDIKTVLSMFFFLLFSTLLSHWSSFSLNWGHFMLLYSYFLLA